MFIWCFVDSYLKYIVIPLSWGTTFVYVFYSFWAGLVKFMLLFIFLYRLSNRVFGYPACTAVFCICFNSLLKKGFDGAYINCLLNIYEHRADGLYCNGVLHLACMITFGAVGFLWTVMLQFFSCKWNFDVMYMPNLLNIPLLLNHDSSISYCSISGSVH